MPELPEVETTLRGIEPHISGKAVKAVVVRQPNLRWPVSPDLSESVTGKKINSIARVTINDGKPVLTTKIPLK